jgi:hypothetical protein
MTSALLMRFGNNEQKRAGEGKRKKEESKRVGGLLSKSLAYPLLPKNSPGYDVTDNAFITDLQNEKKKKEHNKNYNEQCCQTMSPLRDQCYSSQRPIRSPLTMPA